jgi:hypothetical protein
MIFYKLPGVDVIVRKDLIKNIWADDKPTGEAYLTLITIAYTDGSQNSWNSKWPESKVSKQLLKDFIVGRKEGEEG